MFFQAYNPNSNTCKNLETTFTAKELKDLGESLCVSEMQSEPSPHVTVSIITDTSITETLSTGS